MKITSGAAATAVTLLAVATLTACGSSGPAGGGSTSPTGATNFPSTTSPASTTPATTAPGSTAPGTTDATSPSPGAGGNSEANAALAAKLLTASDLKGFTSLSSPGESSSLPCTPSVSVTTTYPPQGEARAGFESTSKQSAFRETLYSYADTATAEKVIAVAEKGFTCSSGTIGGVTIKIVPVGKVRTTTSLDVAQRWDFATPDGTLGTAIIARKGSTIIGLSYQATKAGSSEIDPAKVLELAAEKAVG